MDPLITIAKKLVDLTPADMRRVMAITDTIRAVMPLIKARAEKVKVARKMSKLDKTYPKVKVAKEGEEPKRRGRPKGSKNKPKEETSAE